MCFLLVFAPCCCVIVLTLPIVQCNKHKHEFVFINFVAVTQFRLKKQSAGLFYKLQYSERVLHKTYKILPIIQNMYKTYYTRNLLYKIKNRLFIQDVR